MDPSIKSLTITGSAAEDATRSRLKGAISRRKRVAVKDEDEFIERAKNFTAQAKSIQITKPVAETIKPPVIQSTPEIKVEPKVDIKQIESNVILKPPKQARVKLQPKSLYPVKPVDINTTRKARRIYLNTANLSHRFTRAKKVKEDTEKKPVSTIREYLVQRGVIQEKSKAPEKILRSMYADFMLLNDHAL